MTVYEKSIVPLIESLYHTFTPLEKNIGDFFIRNTEEMDFSSRNIASHLFVSEASLSRFAKKCGFHGYREFIYEYKLSLAANKELSVSDFGTFELNTYQELLNKSRSLIDHAQITRIAELLSSKKRVYVYGRGSSGLAAMEMKLRFMCIGLNIEAITDSHILKMNSVILDKDCLVIGISVSGQTEDIISALKEAKKREAFTLLMTANREKSFSDFCDDILVFASKEHLEWGNIISPQFPVLVMLDILYSRYLATDEQHKKELHAYAVQSLQI